MSVLLDKYINTLRQVYYEGDSVLHRVHIALGTISPWKWLTVSCGMHTRTELDFLSARFNESSVCSCHISRETRSTEFWAFHLNIHYAKPVLVSRVKLNRFSTLVLVPEMYEVWSPLTSAVDSLMSSANFVLHRTSTNYSIKTYRFVLEPDYVILCCVLGSIPIVDKNYLNFIGSFSSRKTARTSECYILPNRNTMNCISV